MIGSAEVGEIVMRAFILRRVGLLAGRRRGLGAGRHVRARADLVRLQGFLTRNGYPYTVLDAAEDAEGRALVERLGVLPDELPLMVCPNGTVLKRPTDAEAGDVPRHHARARSRQALRRGGGRRRAGRARRRRLCRVGRPVGAGARPARLRRPGGSLGPDRELSRLSDRHLRPGAGRARLQPGAEVRRRGRDPARGRAARLRRTGAAAARPLRLELADGAAVQARTVVVASGARYRRPDIPNLASFEGAGVSYWASPVEARLCEGEEVALVGGGNSAGQAVVFLAPKVKHLHLVVRGKGLEATMSRYLIDRIAALPNVELHTGTEIVALEGDRDRRALPARRSASARLGDLSTCRCGTCSCSSAPIRTPIGSHELRRGGRQGLRHHRRDFADRRRRSTARCCRSKPACQACSRSATCAPARPSGWPPPSAKAPRSWRRFTQCWRMSARAARRTRPSRARRTACRSPSPS